MPDALNREVPAGTAERSRLRNAGAPVLLQFAARR